MTAREQSADGYEAETLAAGYRTDLFVGPTAHPDRYELLGPPMSGGEGTTWRARYLGALDQPVQMAVKVLHRPERAGAGWPSAALLDAWRDRVELLRAAAIPNLVRLFDVEPGLEPHLLGQRDTARTVLLQMEWVEGRDMVDEVLHRPADRVTLPERLDWIEDLAEALGGLHGLGTETVHRDVSPNNCIVTPVRRLVLIDLSTMQLPVDGADLLGRHTPAYAAPEVLASPFAQRAPEADRWSFGAIVHLCLTGEHPPRAPGAREAALVNAVQALGAPAAATAAVLALLDDDPTARPKDLREWVQRFRHLLRPRGRARPGRRLRGAALAPVRAALGAAKAPIGVTALLVIAMAGTLLAGLVQLRPVPQPSTDDLQRWLVGTGAGVVGLLLMLLRRRRLRPWVAAVAGLAGGGSAACAALMLQAAWRPSAVPLAVGTTLLAAGLAAPPTRSSDGGRLRTALALGVAAAAVATGGVLQEPLRAHAVPIEVQEVISAVPGDRPAFVDPLDMAVNAAGDTAVLARHGIDQDSVWVLPHGGGARQVVVTSGVVQDLATRTLAGRRGSRPSSITAIAWTDDGALLLLTDRGLFRAALDGDEPELLTGSIVSNGTAIDRILVLQGEILIQGDDVETTPPSRMRVSCDVKDDTAPSVWRLTWDGRTAGPPRQVADSARECVPRVLAAAAVSGTAQYLRLKQATDGYRLTWGALGDRTPVDLGAMPGDPVLEPYWGDVRAVVAGGRLLVAEGECLFGRALDAVPLPAPGDAADAADATACPHPDGLRLLASARTTTADETACAAASRTALRDDLPPAAPIALAPRGAALLLDTLASGCSTTLRRLPVGSGAWTTVQSDASLRDGFDPGRTAFMSADHPDFQADLQNSGSVTWVGDDGRTQLTVNDVTPGRIDLPDQQVRASWSGENSNVALARSPFNEETELVVVGFEGRSQLYVDGLADLTSVGAQHALIARCGQILDADLNSRWFVTQPDGAERSSSDLRGATVRVLAGAKGGLATPCAPLAVAARTDVARPIAVDSVTPTCAQCVGRVVLAERYRLSGRAVAAVRSIDFKTGRVIDVAGGDLVPLALVPTDVAIAADGRIAVATASADGYGPVLMLDRGRRTVLDAGGRWVSGLTWRRSDLVLTDARSGDVVIARVPR